MNDVDVRKRLTNCFRAVFPRIPETKIQNATAATVGDWDSVSAITLMTVIEEEFQIQLDFDRLPDLDSFESLAEYLSVNPGHDKRLRE
jgi:acyl carrier protein